MPWKATCISDQSGGLVLINGARSGPRLKSDPFRWKVCDVGKILKMLGVMERFIPYRLANDSMISRLEHDMQAYYASSSDYSDFQRPSYHPIEWRHVLAEIKSKLAPSGARISVLEFGAGRSGFPDFLKEKLTADELKRLTIVCQDVTQLNESYLKNKFDKVITTSLLCCDLSDGQFDIIFSNQVIEHVARPRQILDKIFELMLEEGVLFLFAPRYDFPCYLSPSCRDLNVIKRLQVSIWLLWIRLIGLLRSEPNFVMDLRPACFNNLTIRDSDAIHWVSRWDLEAYARGKGLTISGLNINQNAPFLSKQWIIDLGCRLSVRMQRPSDRFRRKFAGNLAS
ncbi:MAG: class I SAM-dependent methyltransferase [Synechococcus sp.]|nr:class I SAM-dependent methyltransferase [Synechococcus sp.]